MPTVFDEARVWKIFAGPGCGKTWFITQTIDALLRSNVQPTEIMYVLFNSAPAMSFRASFQQKGLDRSDMCWWGTHHSICMKLLRLKKKNILNLKKWGDEHGFPMATEEEIRERGIDEYGWDATFSSLSKKIYQDSENYTKEEQRMLDELKKTELDTGEYHHVRYLQKALKMDVFPVGVKYLFIDEAQDNGKLQLDWVKRIIDNRTNVKGIMLAGDDKQAINGFKGGQSELFLNFPVDKTVELKETYRLPTRILTEANRIIEPVKKRSSLTERSKKIELGEVLYSSDISDSAMDIKRYLKDGKSVLVLVRNRAFMPAVSYRLNEYGVLSKKESYRNLQEKLVALNTIRILDGFTEETLSAIMPRSAFLRWGDLQPSNWEDGYIEKIRKGNIFDDPELFEAYEKLRRGNVLPMDEAVALGIKPELLKQIRSWDFDINSWFLAPNDLFDIKIAVREYGWSFPTVRIDTIHSVKGEEYDVVVIVGNVTEKTHQSELWEEDEERRVWYVGLTRAKEALILTYLDTARNTRSQIL